LTFYGVIGVDTSSDHYLETSIHKIKIICLNGVFKGKPCEIEWAEELAIPRGKYFFLKEGRSSFS